jgi:hypothetical protein
MMFEWLAKICLGGSASPKTMPDHSPKAQIPGGKAANLPQRVEDNGFHLSLSLKHDARDSVIFRMAEGDKRRSDAPFCGKSFGRP